MGVIKLTPRSLSPRADYVSSIHSLLPKPSRKRYRKQTSCHCRESNPDPLALIHSPRLRLKQSRLQSARREPDVILQPRYGTLKMWSTPVATIRHIGILLVHCRRRAAIGDEVYGLGIYLFFTGQQSFSVQIHESSDSPNSRHNLKLD